MKKCGSARELRNALYFFDLCRSLSAAGEHAIDARPSKSAPPHTIFAFALSPPRAGTRSRTCMALAHGGS